MWLNVFLEGGCESLELHDKDHANNAVAQRCQAAQLVLQAGAGAAGFFGVGDRIYKLSNVLGFIISDEPEGMVVYTVDDRHINHTNERH